VFEKIRKVFRRKVYRYELQESMGAGSKGGWTTVVVMDTPKKEAYAQYFKPGRIYKLLARDLETGLFDKTVWRHYEPSLIPEREEEEKPPPPPRIKEETPTPAEIMATWAEGFKEYIEPLKVFGEVVSDIRQALQKISGGETGGGEGGIPKLEFEGKAPWLMHPYIVKNVGDTVKSITDHFFDRLEEFRRKFQGEGEAPTPTPEIQFPSIEEYEKAEATKTTTPEPTQPTPTPTPEAVEVEEEKPETPIPEKRKRRGRKPKMEGQQIG